MRKLMCVFIWIHHLSTSFGEFVRHITKKKHFVVDCCPVFLPANIKDHAEKRGCDFNCHTSISNGLCQKNMHFCW